MKVYVYDCNGNIVGNKKGYKSVKSAQRVINCRKTLYNTLWQAYNDKMPKSNFNIIYSIGIK